MSEHLPSRRDFFHRSAGALPPALIFASASAASAADVTGASERAAKEGRALRVVCVGGHPDDPESSCAGTLSRYSAVGHSVTVIYLTRGERGMTGKSNDEAASIRSAEATEACRIMGAKAVFAGQIDGSTELNRDWVERFTRLLTAENPDLVFTHWPVDTHMDHQVASVLTQRACLALRPRPALYFFEVNSGSQTQGFAANTYVDISMVVEKKKQALFAHRSQDGAGIWKQHHEFISQWRGREAGVAAAEAFVHLSREGLGGRLPGLAVSAP